MTITTHNKPLDALLQSVVNQSDLVNLIKHVPYVKNYIEQATNDVFPDFEHSEVKFLRNEYHVSMAGALLLSRSSVNFMMQVLLNPKVAVSTKKKQFKAIAEMLSKEESTVLVAVLSKDMASVYPILTHEFMCDALNELTAA